MEEGGRRFGSGERDVGGGINEVGEGEKDGRGPRRGGARAPPDTRWVEFAAGKDGAWRDLSSLNAGIVGDVVDVALARGVVGDGGLNEGRGGGGMAFRSSTSLALSFPFGLLRPFSSPLAVFTSSWLAMAGFLVASIEGRRLNHSIQGR